MRISKVPKLSLVFDEEKRREYLTGFRKRKLERKEKARKAAEARLVEEIKAVKMRYKKAARERLAGFSLPAFIDGTLDTVCSKEERLLENHVVSIEHIDISNSHYFVGSNKMIECDTPASSHTDTFKPTMSLKAALKMNPKKKSKHHKSTHNRNKAKSKKKKKRHH